MKQQKRKKPKKQRKCSVCLTAGHDKRKCLGLGPGKKGPKSRLVLVKVTPKHSKSPHVVDLKAEKEPSVWRQVKTFSEKPAVREERVVVDLAQMVRQANLARKEKPSEKFESEKLKVKTQFKLPRLNIARHLTGIKTGLNSRWRIMGENLRAVGQKFSWPRLAYAALIVLLLFLSPFPAVSYYHSIKDASARVAEESSNAFLSLQSSTVAAFQSNLSQAQYDLNAALESFGQAENILEKERGVALYAVGLLPIIGKQITARQRLLTAGHHLALGNTYLLKGVSESEKPDLPLIDRFEILANHLQSAVPQYQTALEQLSAVDQTAVPVEYQQSFSEFKLLFAALIDDLTDLVELARAMDSVFGRDQFRRYLLVFQNNSELRATGGFMGSFAVMDWQKGKLLKLDIPGGGAYDLQGQLDVFVKPPLPLQLSNQRWEFQDANWFPDFAASAQKIQWFYERARGATTDGVVAINATVLERLLKVIGPLASEKYELEIVEADALEKLQYQVEIDYDKEENRPKEVLSVLAEQFLSQMESLDAVSVIRLLTELHEALEQKEIQLYFNDEPTQQKFRAFGWTGELLPNGVQQDYLAVVGVNLQGQKSDARVKQVVEHQAAVQADGSIIDTVVIHKTHLGLPGELFYGANNVHYVRVYVPAGSELVAAGGFAYPPEDAFRVPENWYETDKDLANREEETAIHAGSGTRITQEFGKTVFGNWMMVEPGNSASVYFTYKLPFKVIAADNQSGLEKWKAVLAGERGQTSRYSLLAQKQSGINYDFSSRVIYPPDWRPVWQTENEKISLAANGAEFSAVLKTDEVFGLVMEKK